MLVDRDFVPNRIPIVSIRMQFAYEYTDNFYIRKHFKRFFTFLISFRNFPRCAHTKAKNALWGRFFRGCLRRARAFYSI